MILEKIEHIEHFTDAEQQILRYLLNNPDDVLNLSIRDLAKRTFTSASTVNRLAGKLTDGQGFTQFKALLFRELHQAGTPLPRNPDPITVHETVFSAAGKVASTVKDTIDQTLHSLDYLALSRAAYLLQNAAHIYFFGFDDNLALAKPYLYRMMTFGKQVIIHDAGNSQYYQALTIPESIPPGSLDATFRGNSPNNGNVAVFISRTGENRRLTDIAAILRDKNVPILLFTPERDSSLGKLADEWIGLMSGGPFDSVGNIILETSLHYILNVLCTLMFSGNYESSRNTLIQYGRLYQASQEKSGLPPSADKD